MRPEDYDSPDPWGYQGNPEDASRKQRILTALLRLYVDKHGEFERALDIGAGEGWITQDLPAKRKFAFEQASKAKERLPACVEAVETPEGTYDLIVATGVMYPHYDYQLFLRLIKAHAGKIVLVSSISDWEVPEVKNIGEEIYSALFPYREWDQCLRIFQV